MRLRLTQPTDFQILAALSDGERDVATNIAQQIGKNRDYINTRLPHLADYGLIKKIGPNDQSGLYQITPLGVAAAEHQSVYSQNRDKFTNKVQETATDITITRPTVQTE